MSEWMPFDHWPECACHERPGHVFEVVNGRGQRLFTTCAVSLPLPFDWTSPPIRFRLVATPPVRHSTPLPSPQQQPE